jgi:Ca2+-binding EF-hand superfamily protein
MRGEEHAKRLFAEVDANADNAITAEEVSAALNKRFTEADGDKDGSLTKAEIISAVEKIGEGRMSRFSGRFADAMVLRADINEDGKVALTEVENRARKLFALMDFNDDGKAEKAEIAKSMPHRGGHSLGGKGRHHGWGGGDETPVRQ